MAEVKRLHVLGAIEMRRLVAILVRVFSEEFADRIFGAL